MGGEFLRWVKDLDQRLDPELDFDLAGSAVYEPTARLGDVLGNVSLRGLRDGIHSPNQWGNEVLVREIAAHYGVEQNNVILTTGASLSIWLVCYALLRGESRGLTGGETNVAVVESPTYPPLIETPRYVLGASPKRIDRDPRNFELTTTGLNGNGKEPIISPQTRLVIISNLHNPSGRYTTEEQLREISGIVRTMAGKDAKILIDETFLDAVSPSFRCAVHLGSNFISVGSLSKIYGLGILRCGWIIATDKQDIDAIRTAYIMSENIGSGMTEFLASLVFSNIDYFHEHWRETSTRNRKLLNEMMHPLLEDGVVSGDIPPYGCLYFPRLKSIEGVAEFVRDLGAKHHVYVAPGHFFCPHSSIFDDYIRVGVGGRPEKIEKGLTELVTQLRADHA